MRIKQDLKTFRHCPEIRAHIFKMYVAKLCSVLTLVLLSPLLILGGIFVGLNTAITWVGQKLFTPFNFLIEWLTSYQQEQVKLAHSVLSIDEIQKRLGTNDEDL